MARKYKQKYKSEREDYRKGGRVGYRKGGPRIPGEPEPREPIDRKSDQEKFVGKTAGELLQSTQGLFCNTS